MTSSPQTEPICWVPDLENVLTEYPSAEIAKILERDILTGNEKAFMTTWKSCSAMFLSGRICLHMFNT